MGIYSEYLEKKLGWPELEIERKKYLSRISELRNGREVLTFASAITKQAPVQIGYDDRVPIFDQISNLKGDKIDLILETPGGQAEIVKDIIEYLRNRFSEIAIIVPGYAKSAGTIMVMAGDEILMNSASALGPIDAQIVQPGKRYSAHAFLKGLDKIKEEVEKKDSLNRAYIPILQNISTGEIQECENLLSFSKTLVTNWLSKYKFKFWNKHSSTGKLVTEDDKKERAEEIAEKLCNREKWLTHGDSITINDLREMRLIITDFSENPGLCDAILRYYILLKLTFDTTNIYKIYETPKSQIYNFVTPQIGPIQQKMANKVLIEFECPNCKTKTNIQANLKKDFPIQKDAIPFPKDNIFICPVCKTHNDLRDLKNQIESQTKKKIV